MHTLLDLRGNIPSFIHVSDGKMHDVHALDMILPEDGAICDLYKSRWQVELFFKWIKQHLRIKKFYGTSENAVKTQIWIAVSVYVLVAIVRKRLKLDASLYTLMQMFSVTAFEKVSIESVIFQSTDGSAYVIDDKQLNLFSD